MLHHAAGLALAAALFTLIPSTCHATPSLPHARLLDDGAGGGDSSRGFVSAWLAGVGTEAVVVGVGYGTLLVALGSVVPPALLLAVPLLLAPLVSTWVASIAFAGRFDGPGAPLDAYGWNVVVHVAALAIAAIVVGSPLSWAAVATAVVAGPGLATWSISKAQGGPDPLTPGRDPFERGPDPFKSSTFSLVSGAF